MKMTISDGVYFTTYDLNLFSYLFVTTITFQYTVELKSKFTCKKF